MNTGYKMKKSNLQQITWKRPWHVRFNTNRYDFQTIECRNYRNCFFSFVYFF
jgi:hypothetical protein